jgi:cell division protein FtsB
VRKVLADMHVPPIWRRWAIRAGLATAVALAIAYLPFHDDDEQADSLRDRLREVRAESARLGAANARLGRQINALATELPALEDQARDLGLIYPGELVLRLEPAPATPVVPPPPPVEIAP